MMLIIHIEAEIIEKKKYFSAELKFEFEFPSPLSYTQSITGCNYREISKDSRCKVWSKNLFSLNTYSYSYNQAKWSEGKQSYQDDNRIP